jgi:hypothetical protein
MRKAGLLSVALALVGVAAACGSTASGVGTTSSPSPTVNDTTAITQNWQMFFAGTTPAGQKIDLLQNGQRYATIIDAQAKLPIALGTKATVSKVTVTSPTTADVTYSISIAGKTVLSKRQGRAVKQGGVWKVGDKSFQQLLSLECQSMPSALPSTTPSTLPSP